MNPRAAYSFSCAAFAALVASASLAGCFSERVAGTDPPPAGDLCEGTPANVIQIRNFAFVQKNLNVSPGTTVTWVNCDTETHTSTSDTNAWDSGALTPGSRFQRTFPAAGSFPFHCTPHPSMKGTVVVS
jgi:plastocyanin